MYWLYLNELFLCLVLWMQIAYCGFDSRTVSLHLWFMRIEKNKRDFAIMKWVQFPPVSTLALFLYNADGSAPFISAVRTMRIGHLQANEL